MEIYTRIIKAQSATLRRETNYTSAKITTHIPIQRRRAQYNRSNTMLRRDHHYRGKLWTSDTDSQTMHSHKRLARLRTKLIIFGESSHAFFFLLFRFTKLFFSQFSSIESERSVVFFFSAMSSILVLADDWRAYDSRCTRCSWTKKWLNYGFGSEWDIGRRTKCHCDVWYRVNTSVDCVATMNIWLAAVCVPVCIGLHGCVTTP